MEAMLQGLVIIGGLTFSLAAASDFCSACMMPRAKAYP